MIDPEPAFLLAFPHPVHPERSTKAITTTMTTTTPSTLSLRAALIALRASLPVQDGSAHKGQAGRICIVGGSPEYTGAPYFAAMSSMRAGADLAYIVTQEQTAALAIKASTPDVVVYPSFDPINVNPSPVLSRAHTVIVGPGLGRSEVAENAVLSILEHPDVLSIPLVIDADALFFIASGTSTTLIRNALSNSRRTAPIVLTPNAMELRRICSALDVPDASFLPNLFGPMVIILAKGPSDEIYSATHHISVTVSASMKRVGGQGDFLAGLVATCLGWFSIAAHKNATLKQRDSPEDSVMDSLALQPEQALLAVSAAASLTREVSCRAFKLHGRSLLASDMLSVIGAVMHDLEFGSLIDELSPLN